jgi:flagellar hook-associated protein 3 FlgL
MTRVSSFGHNQSMINNLLANQVKLARTQEQISSGKKADTYSAMGRDISPLMGAKTVKSQTDTYLASTNSVLDKLTFNDLYLGNVYDQTSAMRDTLMSGLSNEEFSSFQETLQQTFDTVVNTLNTNVGGVYIFGGTRSDAKPVTVDSLADLAALPSVDDAFQNGDVKPSATVDTGVNVEYGMLADDVGRDVMASLKRLAEFQAGPDGPLDGPMTAAQRTFVETEIQNIKGAMDSVTSSQVENGLRTNKMTELRDRHESANVVMETFISNIENVDMADAVTRMQQGQVAMQASLAVLSRLGQMSLLDYI